jgi:hypothetical protein
MSFISPGELIAKAYSDLAAGDRCKPPTLSPF